MRERSPLSPTILAVLLVSLGCVTSTRGTSGAAGGRTPGSGGTTATGQMGSAGTGAGTPGDTTGGGWSYPLKLAPGQHYLVDQKGTPFLMVGEAAWSLLVSLSEADAERYLSTRAAQRFNSVLVNLIEHKFAPNAPA